MPTKDERPHSDIQVWEPNEWNAHLTQEQKRKGQKRNMKEIEIGQTHIITDRPLEDFQVDPSAEAPKPEAEKSKVKGKPKIVPGESMIEPLKLD